MGMVCLGATKELPSHAPYSAYLPLKKIPHDLLVVDGGMCGLPHYFSNALQEKALTYCILRSLDADQTSVDADIFRLLGRYVVTEADVNTSCQEVKSLYAGYFDGAAAQQKSRLGCCSWLRLDAV
ncbi:uncharacterized protein TEOVI_000872500 [Trypanosoma equiperdum]|uniref:Uncharacterized protein n=1 Tax=Trypanosoma equiperdum TaxID=5694 RepID=A0A1G4I8Q2_TRYEQ|nr:hypothetical protein, conserved [Trypanosoma equiperdum]